MLNLVTFVVTQLATGVTVLIARYLGEKRTEQIGPVLSGAAVVFAILSVGMFILLVGFPRPISVLMQAPEEAISPKRLTKAQSAKKDSWVRHSCRARGRPMRRNRLHWGLRRKSFRVMENGLGISVLPELILRRVPYRIVTRPLDVPAYRDIALALRDRETASLAVKRFLEYLKFR